MSEKNEHCSAESADETRIPLADHNEIGRKVLNQPWAIQSAVVTIAAHCTVIKDKCEDGDLSAVSDLAGCISSDLLELANFLAGTEPQTAPDLDQIALEAARKIEALNWNNPTQRTARIQCAVTEALRRSRCQAVSAKENCPWKCKLGDPKCICEPLSRPQRKGGEQ